jgi:hypothetical protein
MLPAAPARAPLRAPMRARERAPAAFRFRPAIGFEA